MVDLDRGHLADVPLDKQIDVREDDERRSKGRTRVVLNNQVVALELPVDVAVHLHFREGVAGRTHREQSIERCGELRSIHRDQHVCSHRDRLMDTRLLVLYLNMAMSRLMSRMLVTSR